jgi:formamidopyrimidine-DNA glycosylase
MTGFFQYIKHDSEYAKLDKLKHTHVDIHFEDGILRYVDARRFGAMIYTNSLNHVSLNKLGLEPLEMNEDELALHLFKCAKKRKQAIKLFITNNEVVVGIGNIYACEVLFESKINPQTICCDISLDNYKIMANHIQTILQNAIEHGGSTIDNFTHLHIYESRNDVEKNKLENTNSLNDTGNNGYFQIQHKVYGKQKQKCTNIGCDGLIDKITQGQRSTYYCPVCQAL